jgi:hypothetical protein
MTDTCPSCLARGIPPAKEIRRGDQIGHGYICRCGHRWATTRSAAAYTTRRNRRTEEAA